MDNYIDEAETLLVELERRHRKQREVIGKVRKSSKKSAVWLLEGLNLSILSRAIKQFKTNDIVAYEIIPKTRLAQEACLMVRYFSSPDVEGDASKAWGKALVYYFGEESSIKYRQFRSTEIYNMGQKALNDRLSAWCHASYDNARNSFMYLNSDDTVYDIDYTQDTSAYPSNLVYLSRIGLFAEQSLNEGDAFIFGRPTP